MRQLTLLEEERISLLTSKSIEFTLIEPTGTGLIKSILDATTPVRRFFEERGLHCYASQKQGPENKVIIQALLLTEHIIISSKASLYRPTTKLGDPRIWFSGLKQISNPNDMIAIIAFKEALFLINITAIDIADIFEKKTGPIWDLVSDISSQASLVSEELLGKLRLIAGQGFIKSQIEGRADTSIGRTLETLLGIPINSRKEPDYRGIEIKSYRSKDSGRETRKTLFAQVANWELSKFKSSREILECFGYARGEELKLNCTISMLAKNSQGLQFKFDRGGEWLVESSDQREYGDFAVWLMSDLRRRLIEKHNETFWVAAESSLIDGSEHFKFTKVLHTRKPIVSQFDILVEQGTITMDHLIKRNKAGRVSERGPLFKIDSRALKMLFPPSVSYKLA